MTTHSSGSPEGPRIAFFAHNRRDSAVARRAQAFLDAGVKLTGFMFRRDEDLTSEFEAWDNIDLGHIEHQRYLKRFWNIAHAFLLIWKHRDRLQDSDSIYFRNLDLGILAYVAKILSRSDAPLVYECLDVHELLTQDSLSSRLVRFIERFLLKRIDLLVVSSEGFLNDYFFPRQGYTGRTHWVENKLYFSDEKPSRPEPVVESRAKPPWVLVWVGILRCQRTLDVLKAAASAMPDSLTIRMHGRVSEFLIDDFEEQISGFANMEYKGSYSWPLGLKEAYNGADFVWGQELDWEGGNSSWLIPNRIYEAPYFGVPVIAVDNTETARIVHQRGLGYVLDEADGQQLVELLMALDPADVADKKNALLSMADNSFVATQKDTQTLLSAALVAKSDRPTALQSN